MVLTSYNSFLRATNEVLYAKNIILFCIIFYPNFTSIRAKHAMYEIDDDCACSILL